MLSDDSHSTFAAFKLTPHPSLDTFYVHSDGRFPSLLALFLLFIYSGRTVARLLFLEKNCRKLKATGWLREREGGQEGEEEVDDEEKRLRTAQVAAGDGESRGVESWRVKTLGVGAVEVEKAAGGEAGEEGRLVAIFSLSILLLSFFAMSSLVSLRPDAEILCYLLGIVSFLALAASRYFAIFKVTLDLQHASGKVRGEGAKGRKNEVFCVRVFVGLQLIMTLLSTTLTGSSLQILPPPFASALCFRQTFLYYAVPLSLNLLVSVYLLGRIVLISHWESSTWSAVLEDGRIRRAVVLTAWIASSFAQEVGVGDGSGSGIWLPVSLGAAVLLAVIDSPSFKPSASSLRSSSIMESSPSYHSRITSDPLQQEREEDSRTPVFVPSRLRRLNDSVIFNEDTRIIYGSPHLENLHRPPSQSTQSDVNLTRTSTARTAIVVAAPPPLPSPTVLAHLLHRQAEPIETISTRSPSYSPSLKSEKSITSLRSFASTGTFGGEPSRARNLTNPGSSHSHSIPSPTSISASHQPSTPSFPRRAPSNGRRGPSPFKDASETSSEDSHEERGTTSMPRTRAYELNVGQTGMGSSSGGQRAFRF